MAKVVPFKALRYSDESQLSNVTTPPYDIISPSEQDAFYQKSEHNVIRLEYGKVFDQDSDSDNRYTRAAQFLSDWLADGTLKVEEADAFYIYEEIFENNGETLSLKGIIGRVELVEFSKRVVLPHEETLSKAKTDRFNLMKATNCNFSQIYSLYSDPSMALPAAIKRLSERKPDISFKSFDNLTQNLWIIKEPEETKRITDAFADKQLFIADGHHRYETALNYRNYLHEINGLSESANYCMMFLVEMEDKGLAVFPTHRLVRDLPAFNEAELVDKMQDNFRVEKVSADSSTIFSTLAAHADKNAYALYTGKDYYYIITLKNPSAMDEALPDKTREYKTLDVSVLHTLILERNLGIDKANMAQQINLTYTRDFDEAIAGVRSGKFQCAFMLNATKISQIKDVSLINEKMPQKSTYFYPKLITGIVMNKF
ncbi:MAG: DUF1015 domain-containing protein [Clostridia bacterium]|nr:DUF1015 domain-containing protein [Clostridia bacterium]